MLDVLKTGEISLLKKGNIILKWNVPPKWNLSGYINCKNISFNKNISPCLLMLASVIVPPLRGILLCTCPPTPVSEP